MRKKGGRGGSKDVREKGVIFIVYMKMDHFYELILFCVKNQRYTHLYYNIKSPFLPAPREHGTRRKEIQNSGCRWRHSDAEDPSPPTSNFLVSLQTDVHSLG